MSKQIDNGRSTRQRISQLHTNVWAVTAGSFLMPLQKNLLDYPGSDLDLARNILKKHHSEHEIQKENEKTIFRFALPLWQDE